MPRHPIARRGGPLARRCAVLALLGLLPFASHAQADAAAALRARYAAAAASAPQGLGEPGLVLLSSEASDQLQGEVYAVVDHPFADARRALMPPAAWCAILVLHINVQYCRAAHTLAGAVLDLGIGRKTEQPLDALQWLHLDHAADTADPALFSASLHAARGPLGTTDFHLAVQALAHTPRQTLVHLTYAYRFGTVARLASQAYLATLGGSKVGFSVVGQGANGQPLLVRGLRGAIERNVLRYHYAVVSHLAAQALPEAQRQQASLQAWFIATERHPQQLHEVERTAYVAMKLRQIDRQATQPPPPGTP